MSGVAFLFPGQGAQYSGMGRELAAAYPESRAVFAAADAALGRSISRLCFSGTEQELALTENTQPAILTVSVAALRALTARGLAPAAVAGHSLGEYTAHVAAASLALPDAVRCVEARGRFMQEAVAVGAGAMAAILGLDAETVRAICAAAAGDEVVAPANLNAPDQTVIAGHTGAVDRAVAAALAAGARRAVPLAVSAPFHCTLMEPAARRLAELLRTIEMADPRVPVYCNVDARAVGTGAAARAALVRQVVSPVCWVDTVRALVAAGIEEFLEIGPGRVLAGLVRRIHRPARVLSVDDPRGVEAAIAELGVAT